METEDQRGRLKDGEEIHLAGIWVVELYLPSNAGSLIDGVERLGWGQGRFGGDNDVIAWLKAARSRPGQWRSLGMVASQATLTLWQQTGRHSLTGWRQHFQRSIPSVTV